MYFLYSVTCFN